jgi:L-seryl-tRNA(Ser) seleniumtransferase
VAQLLCDLTGAEAALVVNNCAAAVLLALSAHAVGREVIVSRGELVEIGGSFRVPDVMRASGAKLVEVGTTNRTRIGDYAAAVTTETALLMRVHRSNFAVVGFTEEASVAELKELSSARNVPLMVDLGSGALVELSALGLASGSDEPSVPSLVQSGADLIAFSGDKLLGGPQAGLLIGSKRAIGPLTKHPLLRALRPDKLTLAALEATLELYRDGRSAEVPTLRMLATPEPTLADRARRLGAMVAAECPTLSAEVVRVRSAVGGGALPLEEPWSWAVALVPPGESAAALDERLRLGTPPILGRLKDERLLLDVRTLAEDELLLCVTSLKEMSLGRK